jgi:hypothetical protein
VFWEWAAEENILPHISSGQAQVCLHKTLGFNPGEFMWYSWWKISMKQFLLLTTIPPLLRIHLSPSSEVCYPRSGSTLSHIRTSRLGLHLWPGTWLLQGQKVESFQGIRNRRPERQDSYFAISSPNVVAEINARRCTGHVSSMGQKIQRLDRKTLREMATWKT